MAINILEAAKAKIKKLADLVPPVAAYKAVQQIRTPQYQDQFKQSLTGQASYPQFQKTFESIRTPISQAIEKFPTIQAPQSLKTALPILNVPSAIKGGLKFGASTLMGEPGQWAKPLGQLNVPEQIAFGEEAGMGLSGAAPAPLALGSLKSIRAASALRKSLPEIRSVRNLVENVQYPSSEQMAAIDQAIEKYSPKLTNALKKMLNNPNERREYAKSLFASLEDQALNPEVSVGLGVKSIRGAQADLTEPVLTSKGGKIKLRVKPVEEVPQAEAIRRISLQPAEITTQKTTQTLSKTGQPVSGGGLPGSGQAPSSPDIISDPVAKITQALKGAKPIRGEQEAIYSQIRAKQAGALGGISEQMAGETGYYRKLGQLKGKLPKVQFESIRKQVTQGDVDYLFNQVDKSNLPVFEKVNAQTGLSKLLGGRGGEVPTERELELLGEVFPKDFIEAVLGNRSTFQKLMSGIQGALNIPRAVMATADLSAPLRQGIFLIGKPKQWIPAFGEMFRYAFSERAYQGLNEGIKARATYPLMREGKLALTDTGASLLKREEMFMSTLVEKIPLFGRIARGSNRAYSGFLNKLRADVFDDLVTKAQGSGIKVQGKTLQDLASFVNSATGRGNLGNTLQRVAPVLNGLFFSPRLMASRINLLNPVTYVKYDPFVRKEALKTLLTSGGILMTILGLAKLGGAEVNDDPRNADFAKIKVGNTRYDILGGFQQYVRLAAQLITGKIVSSTTGKTITLGEGYKPLTRKDILMRFFENKTAPVASFIISLMTGQTGIGEPVHVPTEVISRFIPMVIQDIYDISKDRDSTGQALLMSIPSIFGMGSQTYGKSELTYGKNLIGQETAQVRPVQELSKTISEKLFGKQPLGSSAGYNIETYLDELSKQPDIQQKLILAKIKKTNPDLYDKIKSVWKDKKLGVTVEDQVLKAKGVASGERALAIMKELTKLETDEERKALWLDYRKKKIINDEVEEQLKFMMKKEEKDKSSFLVSPVSAAEEPPPVGNETLADLVSGDYDVEAPKLTGEKLIDDEIMASYKNDISKAKKMIMEDFDDEIIDQGTAMKALQNLKVKLDATKKKGGAKKIKIRRPQFVKLNILKGRKVTGKTKKKGIKLIRAPKLKKVNFKS